MEVGFGNEWRSVSEVMSSEIVFFCLGTRSLKGLREGHAHERILSIITCCFKPQVHKTLMNSLCIPCSEAFDIPKEVCDLRCMQCLVSGCRL